LVVLGLGLERFIARGGRFHVHIDQALILDQLAIIRFDNVVCTLVLDNRLLGRLAFGP
jgi:hypothetical protein